MAYQLYNCNYDWNIRYPNTYNFYGLLFTPRNSTINKSDFNKEWKINTSIFKPPIGAWANRLTFANKELNDIIINFDIWYNDYVWSVENPKNDLIQVFNKNRISCKFGDESCTSQKKGCNIGDTISVNRKIGDKNNRECIAFASSKDIILTPDDVTQQYKNSKNSEWKTSGENANIFKGATGSFFDIEESFPNIRCKKGSWNCHHYQKGDGFYCQCKNN